MAKVVSRKNCMKRVSRRLHKKATTKSQRKPIIGKASKACSLKMRLRRAGKKSVRKTVRKSVPKSKSQNGNIHSQPVPSSVNTPEEIYNHWKGIYDAYFSKISCDKVVSEADKSRDALYEVIFRGGVNDKQIDAFNTAVDDRMIICNP